MTPAKVPKYFRLAIECTDSLMNFGCTCIRIDYEQNISAIFINKVGPLQSAWNIFNSSVPYGINNVENVESIGEIRILKEEVVDCKEYGVTTGDKDMEPGTAESLAGWG